MWFDQDDAEKTSTVKISHLNVVPKYHFEVRSRFENHGAVPVETVRVTKKASLQHVFLTLFSANADVKIPFIPNVEIVQAYSDTSFL